MRERSHGIYSKMDLEAFKALEDYRLALGLDPSPPSQFPAKFIQFGQWINSLAHYDLYGTVTFRPVIRRWPNRKRFAACEQELNDHRRCAPLYDPRKAAPCHTVGLRDFRERLASHTPSPLYLHRFFDRFVVNLEKELQDRLDYFVGFEAGRSGANHFHFLAAAEGLRDFSRREIWEWLFARAGRTLILPYDPEKGAHWYLAAAYIGKRPLGWDVRVGNRPLIRRRPARGGGHDVAPSADFPHSMYHLTLPRWHR